MRYLVYGTASTLNIYFKHQKQGHSLTPLSVRGYITIHLPVLGVQNNQIDNGRHGNKMLKLKKPPVRTFTSPNFFLLLLVVGTIVLIRWTDRATDFSVCSSPGVPSSQIFVGCIESRADGTSMKSSSPFEALEGPGYRIFRPFDISGDLIQTERLLAPPEVWIAQIKRKYERMDPITNNRNQERSVQERSKSAYLEMLKDFVSGVIYGKEEMSVWPSLGNELLSVVNFNQSNRVRGLDWTYLGSTMTGLERINNVQKLISQVVQDNVPGDYLEAGVWRGGSSVFARGVLRALNQGQRKSYVCDSFRGLPPGNKQLHPHDTNWDNTPYLEVSEMDVATSFREASLLDENVIFVKGFFNDSLKPLAQKVGSMAILRLDSDLYESTVDILYHFYDKLSVGGYVIVDDWDGFPSKVACEDFLAVHKVEPEFVRIDEISVYWQKTEQVKIQYWRYAESTFTT